MPYPRPVPNLSQLEQLPYLSTLTSQVLRLSYGVSHHLHRIAPGIDLYHLGMQILAEIIRSMTSVLLHDNSDVSRSRPSSDQIKWLQGNRKDPMKAFVPFSRKTTQYLGIILAYAEIYLTSTSVFRRHSICNWARMCYGKDT